MKNEKLLTEAAVIPVPYHQGFCTPSVWQPPERSSVASDLGEGIQRMGFQTGL